MTPLREISGVCFVLLEFEFKSGQFLGFSDLSTWTLPSFSSLFCPSNLLIITRDISLPFFEFNLTVIFLNGRVELKKRKKIWGENVNKRSLE